MDLDYLLGERYFQTAHWQAIIRKANDRSGDKRRKELSNLSPGFYGSSLQGVWELNNNGTGRLLSLLTYNESLCKFNI